MILYKYLGSFVSGEYGAYRFIGFRDIIAQFPLTRQVVSQQHYGLLNLPRPTVLYFT